MRPGFASIKFPAPGSGFEFSKPGVCKKIRLNALVEVALLFIEFRGANLKSLSSCHVTLWYFEKRTLLRFLHS